ncbi:MAG: hypothetical protein HY262_10950 [Chloroflexi bacterium]|nr:hypothetical protein [Chloroflexota bacterium]
MIVRILAEGQYSLSDRQLPRLNEIDGRLTHALATGDRPGFATEFGELIDHVRRHGGIVDVDYLGRSDIVLPAADANFDEVRAMLGEDGLVPG